MREHHNKPRFPYKVMLYPDWSDLHSKRGEAESPMNSNYFQTQIDFYSLKLLENSTSAFSPITSLNLLALKKI